jgi:glycosyltransferase involved in cell wall biosynthesis
MVERVAISVVIPCYNGARFLRETLESVARQTYPADEVIVVDDGSTDASAAVAASFGPPVRVLRQANQGESVARNNGIAAAAGDWIALLDADDLWAPTKLERQVQAVADSPHDLVCVYTDFYRHPTGEKVACDQLGRNQDKPFPRIQFLVEWFIQPSTALLRRDVCLAERFPETIRLGEDVIFFAQVYRHGRIHRIPECLTGYRVSASQQTKLRCFWPRYFGAKCAWFKENGYRYTAEERAFFYDWMRKEIEERHEGAFWKRKHEDVRQYRAVWAEIFGHETPPLALRRPLYPAIVCRIKDRIDQLLRGAVGRPSSAMDQ